MSVDPENQDETPPTPPASGEQDPANAEDYSKSLLAPNDPTPPPPPPVDSGDGSCGGFPPSSPPPEGEGDEDGEG